MMKRLAPAALLALAACSQAINTPVAAPQAAVRNAGYFAPVLNMEIDFGASPRSGAMIDAAADEVLAVGNGLINGKPPVAGKIDTINFTVLGTAGRDTTVGRKIAHFTMNAQELRQLVHAGATPTTVLDAAHDVGTWTPANDDVVHDYCTGKPRSGFCSAD